MLTAVLVTGVALAAPADSAPSLRAQLSTTTITGPATAGYGNIVRLSGTAPAGTPVTVFLHKLGTTGYTVRRPVVADGVGNYATTYTADTDYRYYAVAGGVASSIGLTQLVKVTCTTSGPLMRSLPFASLPVDFLAYATFQASDGHGTFAGFAYNGKHDFAITSWRAGHPLSIVARITRPYASGLTTVHVDAVTSTGSIVADIEPATSGDAFHRTAFVFAGGHQFELAHPANWTSVVPLGVTAAGIIAEVRIGGYTATNARYYVVSWAGSRSPFKVLVNSGLKRPFAAVDAAGDVSYTPDLGLTQLVRRPSGTLLRLGGTPGQQTQSILVSGSAGTAFYGQLYTGNGSTLARWDLAHVSASGVVPAQLLSPIHSLDWFVATGAGGDVVALYHYAATIPNENRYLRTARGGTAKLPAEFNYFGIRLVDLAADGNGTVAYTATDHLPHLFHCR